jgi:hypothetical protein
MVVITVDLHLHTTFSDGKLPLNKLVDLYGHAGFDAIAITDHLCVPKNFLGFGAKFLNRTLHKENWKEYLLAIEKEKNRAWREYKMIVFNGAEYTNNTFNHQRNAHILAVDMNEFVCPTLDEEAWLKEIRQQNSLTIAAHPLKLKDASSQTYYLIDNHEKFSPLIDAWEVANGRTIWRDMLKTPFSLIASSDLHSPVKWAGWRTRMECEKDPEAIKSFFRTKKERDFVFIYGKKEEITNVHTHSDPLAAEAKCS